MCSLKVAIFTGVLLEVKTLVLYPYHYDHEVLPGEVQTFLRLCQQGLNFSNLPLFPLSCREAPNAHVKYVAHRVSHFI